MCSGLTETAKRKQNKDYEQVFHLYKYGLYHFISG